MSEPKPKIEQLRTLMDAEHWREAVALASKFPRLGDGRAAILSAREAFERPEFQRQLGRDPAQQIEAGIAALEEQYARP